MYEHPQARQARLTSGLEVRARLITDQLRPLAHLGSRLSLAQGSVWLIFVWLRAWLPRLGSAYRSKLGSKRLGSPRGSARFGSELCDRIGANCQDPGSWLWAWLEAPLGTGRLGSVSEARSPHHGRSVSAHLAQGSTQRLGPVRSLIRPGSRLCSAQLRYRIGSWLGSGLGAQLGFFEAR